MQLLPSIQLPPTIQLLPAIQLLLDMLVEVVEVELWRRAAGVET